LFKSLQLSLILDSFAFQDNFKNIGFFLLIAFQFAGQTYLDPPDATFCQNIAKTQEFIYLLSAGILRYF